MNNLLTKLEHDFVKVEESLETTEKMFAATNSRGFIHPEIFFIGAVDNFRHTRLLQEVLSLGSDY